MVVVLRGEERVGYMPMAEVRRLGMRTVTLVPTDGWLLDRTIAYHSDMAAEQGLLKGDLNPIRQVLLQSYLYRKRKDLVDLEEIRFERQLLASNMDLWKRYRDRKDEEEQARVEDSDITWRTPESEEELLSILTEFAEEMSGGEDEEEVLIDDVPAAHGSVFDSVLNESDWRELGG